VPQRTRRAATCTWYPAPAVRLAGFALAQAVTGAQMMATPAQTEDLSLLRRALRRRAVDRAARGALPVRSAAARLCRAPAHRRHRQGPPARRRHRRGAPVDLPAVSSTNAIAPAATKTVAEQSSAGMLLSWRAAPESCAFDAGATDRSAARRARRRSRNGVYAEATTQPNKRAWAAAVHGDGNGHLTVAKFFVLCRRPHRTNYADSAAMPMRAPARLDRQGRISAAAQPRFWRISGLTRWPRPRPASVSARSSGHSRPFRSRAPRCRPVG
jgi:hypothetical protein